MPQPKATSQISGSAMFPIRLGMASLRHTSRLRKNTGHQRSEISGGRHTEGEGGAVAAIGAVVVVVFMI